MKKALRDKVFAFASEKRLFSAPCHVLLGVSGGADSMALLHALTHWIESLKVSAIHINHGLRGEYADRDEMFVRSYCAEHGIPLVVVHADVSNFALREHLTTEEAGRQVRYEQFEETRRAIGADYVLTAHTADDQTETVLMHLIRGCGIDGLAGIPAARGNIRRPLLCCSRAEVEEYCALHNLPFVTDETNVDVRYTRNAVRHKVLPLLREINPSVGDAVLRLSGLAQADTDYLNDVAAEALSTATQDGGYLATVIAELPLAIRRRVIRLFLREVSLSSIEEAYIAAVDECILHHNGMVSLCDGYTLFVEQGLITVQASRERIPPETVVLEEIPCSVRFGEFDCSLTERDHCDGNVHNLFLQSTIDCDKIEGKLCLRCRQTGDYMHPAGRGVGKSLKKLMNEWHIPAHIRDTYPLLCDEQGVVLVPGYACDERVKVTDATKHYLVCDIGNV